MKATLLVCLTGLACIGSFPLAALPKQPKPAKNYTALKTIEEYESACKATTPTVIVFNSPTCNYCHEMEPHFNAAAKKYKQAKFYTVDVKDPAFANLKKKVEILGYPTTHFIAPGKPVRVERGGMSAAELDDYCYECALGKRKPVALKKSLQEPIKTAPAA